MKTFILTDETYTRLMEIPGVAELLAPPEAARLPPDRELVRMARERETPAAFERAVAFRDAGRSAADDTRQMLEALIMQAHAAGIGPTRLGEWAQLRPRRIYELISDGRSV
jgi:hypothetical protein